jgi:D-alanyl-D-alanine carboxypeptidase
MPGAWSAPSAPRSPADVPVRLALAAALLALAGCSDPSPPEEPSPSATTPSPSPTSTATPSAAPEPDPQPEPESGAVPPDWLGTRVLPRRPDGFGEVRPTPPELLNRRFTLPDTLEPLPGDGFTSRVEPVPPDVLARSTWQPECPVAAEDLAWVRLTFWGFDDARHTGELLVDATVADDLVTVFRALYDARFPIEEMRITRLDELDAPPTGDGNNTGAFACRPTVGATTYSQHAYGLALDLNSFQNPYEKGDLVLPELSSAYLDRARVRRGMIRPNDVVVTAFASIGWEWGGDWQSLKDYQHFSRNGR